MTEEQLYLEFNNWIDDYVQIDIPLVYDDSGMFELVGNKLDGHFRDTLFKPWLLEYYGENILDLYEKGAIR